MEGGGEGGDHQAVVRRPASIRHGCSALRAASPLMSSRRRWQLRDRHRLQLPPPPGRERLHLHGRGPWSQAAEAVRAWQAFAPHAPDGLFSVCDLLATDPSAPNARAHVVSSGQVFGPEHELHSLIQPLVDTGTPIRARTATMSYMRAVLKWAGCHGSADECHLSPRGILGRETFKGASDYVSRPLRPQAVATLVHRIELLHETLGRGAVLMDAYGGAVNRMRKGATAFVHRDALFSCQYVASWNPGERPGPRLNWVRKTRANMRPTCRASPTRTTSTRTSSTGRGRITAQTTAGSSPSSGVTIRGTSSASARASRRVSRSSIGDQAREWCGTERVAFPTKDDGL
jgi:hypothetical protein